MFYEFLKENNLNPLAISLITDGIRSHSRTAAVVASPLFGDVIESGPSFVFPGAHPEETSQYTGFTREEYELGIPQDPDEEVSRVQDAMDQHPFVLVYNHSFFLKFLRKIPEDLELTQWLNPGCIVDICDIASSSQYMSQFNPDPEAKGKQLSRLLQDWLKARREVQAGVPFAKVAASVDDSLWDENMPDWLRSHMKLRKSAEML